MKNKQSEFQDLFDSHGVFKKLMGPLIESWKQAGSFKIEGI
jgi:hypothetical protein